VSHLAQNQTTRPLALDGGRVLAPGERADIDFESEHDKALEAEGALLRIQATKKAGKS
jgi:hypothetical protein